MMRFSMAAVALLMVALHPCVLLAENAPASKPSTQKTAVTSDIAQSELNPDPAVVSKSEPGNAMILSTGDNLFFYKWFPIDSPAGIGASFDIFKSHYNVDRIIWRGAQAQWMAQDNVFRPEPEEIFDLYKMEMALETDEKLSYKGGEEARKRGLSYWGYMPLFEVGAGEEPVAMSGFGPYAFEEKIRAEHPEYRLYDRAGITSGSTIEFGYPEVRRAFLDRYEKMLQQGADFSIYDGIIFYTYVENFFPRYSNQFIYSDLAVKEFKARYGVDVTKEPFDRAKFLEMRGEYVTQYLGELRQLFDKYGKKLAIYIDAREPDIAMRWPSYPGILVPGEIKMDWRTWIKKGIFDEICLRSASKMKDISPFLDAIQGTKIRLSLLTNEMPAELRPLYDRGVTRHLWSPELSPTFPPEDHPASDIDSTDRIAVMSVLRQVRDGKLDIPVEKITALFHSPDLILRRQAVAAVLGQKMTGAIPALEEAAMDPENSFRAVVIDALGTLNSENTVKVIGTSLGKYPVSGMRIVARTAWRMMVPQRTGDLIALYRSTKSDYVRQTLLEMLVSKHAVPAIDATPPFRPLIDEGAASDNHNIRMMAAFAAAYFPDRASAELLLKLLNDPSEIVQNAAVFSLGEMARRIDDRAVRESVFQQLTERQSLYGEGSKRGDLHWGYRVVAESLLYGFGPRGERQLVQLLNGKDPTLADQAWRVLFHPNDGWNFYPIDPEKGEALYAYYPNPTRLSIEHKVYSLPAKAQLLTQTFSGAAPDAAGAFGNVWTAAGRWTGIDQSVKFEDVKGKTCVALSAADGEGGKLGAAVAWDMSDGRFKNRLRGHFPASPVAYGVADGVVELSWNVLKSANADAIRIDLSGGDSSAKPVSVVVDKNGKANLASNVGDSPADSAIDVPADEWQQLTLTLDFNNGVATLRGGDSAATVKVSFDVNQHYREIRFTPIGDAGTTTRIAAVQLTQSAE